MGATGGRATDPRRTSTHPIGELIRERRLARGWTQEHAAERAGVSVGSWRSTETGRRRPRPATFAAIIAALELSPDDVRRARTIPLRADVEAAREELVRRCRDELPAEHVEVVLQVVRLATREGDRPG